jgi:hypothetical protein
MVTAPIFAEEHLGAHQVLPLERAAVLEEAAALTAEARQYVRHVSKGRTPPTPSA